MATEVLASQQTRSDIVPLGTRNGIELAILRRTEKTLGKIIARPNSPELIDGVQIEPLQVYPDDRGYFTELARLGKGLAAKMVPDDIRKIQMSFTLTYPGTIKAIHYHSEQTDLWAPVSGMVQVFLYDLRLHSKTFGAINTIFAGRFFNLGKFSSRPVSAMATKRSVSNRFNSSISPIAITTRPTNSAFPTTIRTSPTTGKFNTSSDARPGPGCSRHARHRFTLRMAV